MTLENGVQVMLVHDPTGGAKAAAAMDVHVGQYHDPVCARRGRRRTTADR